MNDRKKSPELKSTMRVNDIGVVEYVLEDGRSLHRTGNKPARIDPLGIFSYWENGVLHRKQGPAIISHDGSKGYYQNGECLMIVRADGEVFVNDANGKLVSVGR